MKSVFYAIYLSKTKQILVQKLPKYDSRTNLLHKNFTVKQMYGNNLFIARLFFEINKKYKL